MSEKNNEIKKAKKILENISQDEHERYLAELRQKYIMDQKAIKDAGYDEGYETGTKDGIKKEKTNILKKLLAEKVDVETISKITDLSIDEIEKIKNS